MFESLTGNLRSIFDRLRAKGRLASDDVDSALGEVRLALLEADVNVDVVASLLKRIRDRAVGAEVARSLTPGQQVVKIVHEELIATLGGSDTPLVTPSGRPQVVVLVGLQGSGKTTTAAKLALHIKRLGRRPLLVAADLRRPAAIDQLETLGREAGVEVLVDRATTAPRLVKAARKRARGGGFDAIVVDTAGRLQVDAAMMEELEAVCGAVEADDVLLVVDAMTGQDAVNVAAGFSERIPITGLVLSKLDGDARGGAAISAREVTGKAIKLAGVGESLADLEPFHPERMASRILGMGDVMTLIEKAERAWDEQSAAAAAEKMMTASFTLEDFLEQFQQIRRMGSVGQLLGMLPGAAPGLRGAEVSDAELSRVEAIIRSMTPAERRDPKAIDGGRKRRIASGSGTSPQDVNRLLRQFAETQKMMKAVAGGTLPIPGLPGLPGPGRRRRRKR
jgi:signal recognition particle subunit SRP54